LLGLCKLAPQACSTMKSQRLSTWLRGDLPPLPPWRERGHQSGPPCLHATLRLQLALSVVLTCWATAWALVAFEVTAR
jgi:hypothetical protein